jgi:hypothetical protein
MRIYISITEFQLGSVTKVEPKDILDGVRTLTPSKFIAVEIPAPGRGPDFFLNWCKAEFEEAKAAEEGPRKSRKSFNVAVLAKCAVECLVDWYLSRHLLHLTISRTAGLVQKLEALKAEELFGIGLSLFDDNLFGPRNSAIHDYEPVDFDQAEKAFQLANLTVRNCKLAVPPQVGPVFYGNLKIARDKEVQQYSRENIIIDDNSTAFYFGGFPDDERVGVFFHRNGMHSRIAILSQSDNKTNVIYAPAKEFSPDEMRDVITHIESSSPSPLELTADEQETVFNEILGSDGRSRTASW